jgi:hypothetical protein
MSLKRVTISSGLDQAKIGKLFMKQINAVAALEAGKSGTKKECLACC